MLLFVLFLLVTIKAQQDEWIIQLQENTSPSEYAAARGMTLVGPITFLPRELNYYMFRAKRGSSRMPRADDPGVQYAKRLQPRFFAKRGAPDPLYDDQWHLHTHPFSVETTLETTGKGVVISIVDDGVQRTHPDLAQNFDFHHSWDYNDEDSDPSPHGNDAHGTSAAGVAAALSNNGVCGRGVAPNATIVGVRLIAAGVTDMIEAQGLHHQTMAVVDIVSCSWGPVDDGMSMGMPDGLAEAVLASNTIGKRGRLGKGTIYVWASGNGRSAGDNCAFDGYASSPYVFAIGALDHQGNQAWYSEGCAALMAVTPSSGADMKGIVTTDITGSAGYSNNECNTKFGGTSSATPLAAGLIALVLEARPELTWRDVRHIIARAGIPVNPTDDSWGVNRRGFKHSNRYGFGMLKVPTLLAHTRAHVLVPHMKTAESPILTFGSDEGGIPFRHVFMLNHTNMTFVETVMVRVAAIQEPRGSLTITLTSPDGIVSLLAEERPNDRYETTYPIMGWVFTSLHHWGEERVDGNWTLQVSSTSHRAGLVTGTQLRIWGY